MNEVTTKELRRHLGLSPPGLQKLLDAGIVEKRGRNRWALDECRRRYLDHLRAVAARHGAPDGRLSLVAERAKLAAAQREKVELDTAERRGRLVDVEKVKSAYFGRVRAVREQLLAIPARLAADLAVLEDPAECERLIDSEIRDTLEALTSEPRD